MLKSSREDVEFDRLDPNCKDYGWVTPTGSLAGFFVSVVPTAIVGERIQLLIHGDALDNIIPKISESSAPSDYPKPEKPPGAAFLLDAFVFIALGLAVGRLIENKLKKKKIN